MDCKAWRRKGESSQSLGCRCPYQDCCGFLSSIHNGETKECKHHKLNSKRLLALLTLSKSISISSIQMLA
jgi:hypothetical protein